MISSVSSDIPHSNQTQLDPPYVASHSSWSVTVLQHVISAWRISSHVRPWLRYASERVKSAAINIITIMLVCWRIGIYGDESGEIVYGWWIPQRWGSGTWERLLLETSKMWLASISDWPYMLGICPSTRHSWGLWHTLWDHSGRINNQMLATICWSYQFKYKYVKTATSILQSFIWLLHISHLHCAVILIFLDHRGFDEPMVHNVAL